MILLAGNWADVQMHAPGNTGAGKGHDDDRENLKKHPGLCILHKHEMPARYSWEI